MMNSTATTNPIDTSASALQYTQVEQGVTGLVDSLTGTVAGLLGVVALQNGVDTTPLPPIEYGPVIPDSIRSANAWTVVYRSRVAAGFVDIYVDSVLFLLLGGLLFVYFEWRGGSSGPGGSRIAITPGLVEHLAAGFGRTWQGPPTGAEVKGLVDEYAKEEIATREAATPPSDAELQAWWDAHPDSFRA